MSRRAPFGDRIGFWPVLTSQFGHRADVAAGGQGGDLAPLVEGALKARRTAPPSVPLADAADPVALGDQGNGVSVRMMEQWLERIEGDPSYLLRNQFMIREQQEMQNYRQRFVETRPW